MNLWKKNVVILQLQYLRAETKLWKVNKILQN